MFGFANLSQQLPFYSCTWEWSPFTADVLGWLDDYFATKCMLAESGLPRIQLSNSGPFWKSWGPGTRTEKSSGIMKKILINIYSLRIEALFFGHFWRQWVGRAAGFRYIELLHVTACCCAPTHTNSMNLQCWSHIDRVKSPTPASGTLTIRECKLPNAPNFEWKYASDPCMVMLFADIYRWKI